MIWWQKTLFRLTLSLFLLHQVLVVSAQGHYTGRDVSSYISSAWGSHAGVMHGWYDFEIETGFDDVLTKSKEHASKIGHLSLIFEPVNDRNVYLIYNYAIKEKGTKAEFGYSVNYFKAFSFKFIQIFQLENAKNKQLCLK